MTHFADTAGTLAALNARIAADLAKIAHPNAPWLKPRICSDGIQAYDVVIVGGGQSGLATAFALLRSQVTNILVLDKAPRDLEGPWRTYARIDNAAVALEAGARDVVLLCQREAPQVIQPYRWLTFRGFLRHLCDLDDA
jgi:hypothetical protein